MKCCRLLHKTSTISIPYQPLFYTIGYYYSYKSVSPNLVMAAAARVLPSLRSVINALVPTQDGRSVSSGEMDAFILTIELVYRGIL